MPVYGPNNAGTCVNDAAVGTVAWNAPGNAQGAINGTYSITNSAGMPGAWQANYLKATNFGFAIPGAETIVGVVVGIQRRRSGPSTWDTFVQLVVGGVVSGANRSVGALWPGFSAPALDVFGGAADTWGLALTPAIVNNVGFGCAVAPNGINFSTGQVDAFEMRVYTMAGDGMVSCCDFHSCGCDHEITLEEEVD
jgi:hypothetical protein